MSRLILSASLAILASGAILSRTDSPFQYVPSHATTPDNAFDGPAPEMSGQPAITDDPIPAEYQPRSIDIPFTLLNFGKLKLFPKGQVNTPSANTDVYSAGKRDFANQSACGIPDDAVFPSKVAIHPYWLKYAPADLGLSRYCMQDVCISVWNETGYVNDDVELKVTDICSTDPSDPSYCESPADIKIDRRKADLLYHATAYKTPDEIEALQSGTGYPRKVWWFFSKCWDDGLVQPAYNRTSNWFANPPLPNNLNWSEQAMTLQGSYNNISYPAAGLPIYKNGALKQGANRQAALFPIDQYWKPGDKEPEWCPVAGGKGFGNPTGTNCSSSATK